MRNIAKLSVTNFIDKCANVLLGVAGSTSLGLLCGHAYRKVVPSEKGFDATATALFGGSLYIIDTVGKKFFDPIFKNFGSSTKTVVSGMRLALEAGLAYKLTEIVAKQLEAPFEMTPYDTQFFGTCAAVGIAGMVGYAKVSEKTQDKGIFVITSDRIIKKAVRSLQRYTIKPQPFSLEKMDRKGIEALAACPKEHYHISVNEEGELEVKEGSAKEVFGSTPSSVRELSEKFALITRLYESFLSFFEKEELGIGKTKRAELEKIKKTVLLQVRLAQVPFQWSKDSEQIAKLNARVEHIERAINDMFVQAQAASQLKQELKDLEGEKANKEQLMPLAKFYWAFLTNQRTYAELERNIEDFLTTVSNQGISSYLYELLDKCQAKRQKYQWEKAIIAPKDDISFACNDFHVLRRRLEKYFPVKGEKIPKFLGTKKDLIQLCEDLMKCGSIIMKGIAEGLEKASPYDAPARANLLGQKPGASNKANSSPYYSQAFFFLPKAYQNIVQLNRNAQNPNVKILGNNWQENFFVAGKPQDNWRQTYNEACRAVCNALEDQWPEEGEFRIWATPHEEKVPSEKNRATKLL